MVAISVSVNEMITIPAMVSRAGIAIALLVLATIISLVGLLPHITVETFGFVIVLVSSATLVFATLSLMRIVQTRPAAVRDSAQSNSGSLGQTLVKGLVGVVPVALILVGAMLLWGSVLGGLLWLAGGLLAGIVASVLVAWVILVEIRR